MAIVDVARHVHHHAGSGEGVRVIMDLVTVKAAAADTGDAWSLFEVETPPSGGFPAHIRRHDDQGFYVIDGTYTFLLGEEEITLRRGEFLLVPRGTVHAYANPGPAHARMLLIVTPGGITERFFDEVVDRPDRPVWEPDMAKVLAVAPKYGIEIKVPGTEPSNW